MPDKFHFVWWDVLAAPLCTHALAYIHCTDFHCCVFVIFVIEFLLLYAFSVRLCVCNEETHLKQ